MSIFDVKYMKIKDMFNINIDSINLSISIFMWNKYISHNPIAHNIYTGSYISLYSIQMDKIYIGVYIAYTYIYLLWWARIEWMIEWDINLI